MSNQNQVVVSSDFEVINGKRYKKLSILGKTYRFGMGKKYRTRRLIAGVLLVGIVATCLYKPVAFATSLVSTNGYQASVGKEQLSKTKSETLDAKNAKKTTITATNTTGIKHEIVVPNDYRGEFINSIKDDAVKASKLYNVYPSIMIAQAIIESDYGRSQLTQKANNFFGVKYKGEGNYVTMPTAEYTKAGKRYMIDAKFQSYATRYDSMVANASLLRNGPDFNHSYYSGAWRENAKDYKEAAQGLQGHYATAPDYAQTLIKTIQVYGLNYLD